MGEMRSRDDELQELKRLIVEWNASRLDMFAISEPNEDLEYRGAMRFYFQDSGSKVATKCVRFTSTDDTESVTKVLVDKFHPDMKMLSNPTYSLYEVHPNGESRKLRTDEYPLRTQLEWQKNDREGRFLLVSDSDKIVHSNIFETNKNEKSVENTNLKRSLSRREKKQLKKKREEEAKRAAENKKAGKDDIATQLYDELPETSFTRSISNPEAVMRRRRQQKIEKRLKDFQSKDTAAGGTLKIFATTLKPEIPYKTLLVSVDDSTLHVIKEALIKYQMEKEDPEDYCLIMVNIPPEGHNTSATLGKERVVHDEDCPLKIAVTWPPSRGTVVFHLRRRANLPQHRQERRRSKSPSRKPIDRTPEKGMAERLSQSSIPEHQLPYLLQMPADGMDPGYKPRIHRLQMNVTEVGSEKSMSAGGNYLVLHAPHILPRHCVITNMDGRVSVTPSSGDAEVSVNGKRFYETTTLTHNDVVKIGRMYAFRFCDPVFEKPSRHSAPAGYHDDGSISSSSDMEAPRRARPSSLGLSSNYNHHPSNDYSSSHDNMENDYEEQNPGMFETTFDVTGEVTTYTGRTKEPESPPIRTPPPRIPTQTSFAHEDLFDDKLPATLEFLETGEDAFFAAVVSEVNGQAVHFKLAPTYTLYMCSRFRMSPAYRPELTNHQRGERLGVTLLKIANMARSTIRDNNKYPGSLAFWMANCSELLHFIKHDRDISPYTKEGQPHGQQVLAQSVHQAFRDFVRCAQNELRTVMSAFIDPTDGADMEDSDLDSLHEKDTENLPDHLDGRSYHVYGPDGTLSGNDSWFGGRRTQGRATVSEVIYNLSSTMSLLRRCRVNAALTIQVFSQLFHFINTWLFNKLVLEPKLGLCTKDWGRRISKRLARVEKWAEKQGLELAADCHLCRIAQAAHLLQAPKNSVSDVNAVTSSCFKLNSLQVRTLLENYRPGPDEYIPQDLVESMVIAAEENADEVARSNGQEIQLEEDWELQLPFLLPEDGYSCEVIRGVPPGLKGFLEPLAKTGLCKLTLQPETSGLWTVYMKKYEKMSLDLSTATQSPTIEEISFNKGRGGMGLSIVAAKGTRQDELGIYIKQVVKDGPASKDGRLKAGDQILSVNGESLVGVTQERAAEVMVKSGANVSLKILKQGAIYHGLATLIIQSPTKESPQRLTPLEPENDIPQSSPTLPDDNIPGYLPRNNSLSAQGEERLIDDRRRSEAEERLKEEQRLRDEQESRLREEQRIREEENQRIRDDERLREEQLRKKEEEIREEERRNKERSIEEERIRQEEEDRLYEERRRLEEEERAREEERRRVEEQRAREAERQRQINIEEERRRREAEEDEKFRIQEDRIRKRMEEERRIIEEERRKLAEERKLLEEERKKEEERKRAEQQRLVDEQRRLEEEKKRIDEEKRRQMMALEQRRRDEEERRRRQEEEEEEEAQIIAEEQRRRQELIKREEFRRREDQRRIAEEKKRTEEEARREANEPPKRRSRRIRFEDEVMPQVTTVEQQAPPSNPQNEINVKKEEVVEEEPVVIRGRLTEADISNMNAVFEKLEEEPNEEPPRSPIRVDSRNTRYGRAIVVTQGMIATPQSPSSPLRPSKPAYDFEQASKEQQKQPEQPKESDFERWQRQQRELAERREREAENANHLAQRQREDNERHEREEREREERELKQREDHERQLREERERQKREERERQERERQEREERERQEREERERKLREERIEHERQEEEKRLREERERRDQERRERMQRAKLERERREREEQEREKEEAKRKMKEKEDLERVERERELERQRKEQKLLEEKTKQQEEHRERLEAEKERLRVIERERKMLYPDDTPSNKTLDYIEAMSEDEVEREFQRRLEAENKRKGDQEDRRAGGLVSVTRVTYHPERNDQSERDRRLQVILQEQRMLDKDRNRQRKHPMDHEREQEEWLQSQKERHEQNRRDQGKAVLDKKALQDEDLNKKRNEVQLKREQDDEVRRNLQSMREEAERKLREEHQQQRRQQQLDLERKIEEQGILREKENEARQQLLDEQRRRSGRVNEPDHVMELKERALRDYERRRGLIDQEIARQQADVKFQEEVRQKEMEDVKTKFDQQRPVSALKTTNGTKPKKQVSFSQMSTEIREPASPTYVVESSSGYTAKITPAASVRLVETRPPAIHTPPDSPLSSPPDSPPESPHDYPPIPRPPPPLYDEYDPPPLPPPPSELLEDDDDFPPPPPPRSPISDRSSSTSSDPRSPVDNQYNNSFSSNYSSNQRNAVASGYGTYPRAARPMSYPAPADLDSIQLSDSMRYSGSNNNIINMNTGIRETRSLGRIPVSVGSSQRNGPPPIPKKPEYMGFKDKMKLFNQDKTPENKITVSRWQREQFGVNGDITYT